MGMADDLLLVEPQPFIQKAMRVLADQIQQEQARKAVSFENSDSLLCMLQRLGSVPI